MNFNYPYSQNCPYSGFPPAISVHLGELASTTVAGATLGSKVDLQPTPSSGEPQGTNVADEPLPQYQMIYSDTGIDSTFRLKVSFGGTYSFYRESALDTTLRFNSTKSITVQGDFPSEEIYSVGLDCQTSIAATSNDKTLFPISGTVREFYKSSDDDWSPQYIFIYGNWFLFSHNSYIKITVGGVDIKLTYISMPMGEISHPYFVVTYE